MTDSIEESAIDCHYISRFLTKPWEVGQRRLWYYDVNADCIVQKSSRSLFAKTGLNSRAVEKRFDQLIESPLSSHRNAIASGELNEIKEWKVYRAFVLAVLLQAPRAAAGIGIDAASEELIASLQLPEEHIDQIVSLFMSDNHLMTITVSKADRLFFPSTGIFTFPLSDPGCVTHWTFGYGLPITTRTFIAVVSRTFDEQKLREQIASPGFFSTLSVGFADHCTKIVISPDFLESHERPDLVAQIKSARARNRDVVGTVQSVRQLVATAYERVGLRLGPRMKPTNATE